MQFTRFFSRALFSAALIAAPLTAIAVGAPPASAVGNAVVLTATGLTPVGTPVSFVPVGNSVGLHAQTPFDLAGTGETVTIWRLNGTSRQWMKACSTGTDCWTTDLSSTPTVRTYIATIENSSLDSAYSDVVTVKWVYTTAQAGWPSTTCAQNVPVFVEGVTVTIGDSSTGTERDICARLDAFTGGVGGKLVVTSSGPTVDLGALPVPSILDGTDSCTGASGNLIPGAHPIASAPGLSVDAYFNGSQAWICLTSAARTLTVVQRIETPSPVVDPGISVSFDPDPIS